MQIIKIADIELKVNEDNLLTTAEVAKYYGVTPQNIRTHKKQHSREIKEGYHYIEKKSQKGTKKLYWTFEGLYIIGFFIRSKEAEKYRAYVSDFLAQIKQGNVEVRPKEPKLLPNCEEELEAIIKNSPQYNGLKGLVAKLENELARKQSEIKNLELKLEELNDPFGAEPVRLYVEFSQKKIKSYEQGFLNLKKELLAQINKVQEELLALEEILELHITEEKDFLYIAGNIIPKK